MQETEAHNQRIASLTFTAIYPLYLTKITKKGRTQNELDKVIEWLTGFSKSEQQKLIEQKVTFETFFKQATLNPNAELIAGTICGYKIQEIQNPLTKQIRYLDKLVDELAKGKKLDKILRK